MIHADEEPAQLAQAVGDEIIDVNIDRMNENAKRRKNKWRSDR